MWLRNERLQRMGGGLGERLRSGEGDGLRVARTGEEVAEFYFTANPGEDAKPLREVASGGELSRLMLLIKHVTAPTLFPRTLIFDEIDAGIGGRVADSVDLDWDSVDVGERLDDLPLSSRSGMPLLVRVGFALAAAMVVIMLIAALLIATGVV